MTKYDPAYCEQISGDLFFRLANGQTLDQICATPGWPSRPTIRAWAKKNSYISEALAQGRNFRRRRERYPFDAAAAQDLLHRIRLGEPLGGLLRQPGRPHRRMLNAWKRQNPDFAAELEAAKAFADPSRRRYGRRRARMRFDQDVADRIMLAVLRGATLPELGRDPTLPSPIGLQRWRKADPEFDAALRSAMKYGHKARGRARAAAFCSPRITRRVTRRIVDGASLAALGREPDMPSLFTLYKWVRTRPDFAAEVARACEFRDWVIADQAVAHADRLAADPRAASRVLGAASKTLGQLNPHPGARRRE
jgi:hypothetical protein